MSNSFRVSEVNPHKSCIANIMQKDTFYMTMRGALNPLIFTIKLSEEHRTWSQKN